MFINHRVGPLLSAVILIFAGVLTAQAQTATKAITNKVWRIGLDADMSAVAAQTGEAIRRGAQLAIDEVNAKGGVLGRPLLLDVRDHRGNPARGKANIQALATKADLVAVIGGMHSPVMLHELEAIHDAGVLTFSPWAAGNGVVDNGYDPNYVYRVSLKDQHAASILLQDILRSGYGKVGLLLENTAWGRSNEAAMGEAARQLGLEIVKIEWFNWRQKSMEQSVRQIAKAGAEVMVMVANGPEGATIVQGMASLEPNQRLPIWSHWGIANREFLDAVGKENLNAVKLRVVQSFAFSLHQHRPEVQALFKRYQEKFGQDVSMLSIPSGAAVAHAYDIVMLLVKAMEQGKSADMGVIRTTLEHLEEHNGIVKHYSPAFTPQRHDALGLPDYHLAEHNEDGYLIPVAR